jgi:hypothetical protein
MRAIVHTKQTDFVVYGQCLQTSQELILRFGQVAAAAQV